MGMIFPHDWWSSLQCNMPDEFSRMFGTAEIQTFWTNQRQCNPKLHRHPMLHVDDYAETFVPYFIHGDGGEFQKRDSFMVADFVGALGYGNVKDMFLYLWTLVRKDANMDLDTHKRAWKIQAWSFNAIYYNEHPSTDWDGARWPANHPRSKLGGKPLAPNGFRGVCWGIIGDLDFFNKDIGMPASNCNQFCWNWPADCSDMAWNKLGARSKWVSKVYTPAAQRRMEHLLSHPLFSIVGVGLPSLMLDALRVIDCHGVASHTIASTLFAKVVALGGEREKALGALWVEMREIAKELNMEMPISNFRLKMICDPSAPFAHFPCLSSAVKAAETRHLAPIVWQLAVKHETPDAVHVTLVNKLLTQIYMWIDTTDDIPTAEDGVKLIALVDSFLVNYEHLAETSWTERKKNWGQYPKFHHLWHWARQSQYMNPRKFWTYGAEDFVGEIVKIAFACNAGTNASGVSVKVANRFICAFDLLIQET
jgi:hypothetical protein